MAKHPPLPSLAHLQVVFDSLSNDILVVPLKELSSQRPQGQGVPHVTVHKNSYYFPRKVRFAAVPKFVRVRGGARCGLQAWRKVVWRLVLLQPVPGAC